MKALVTVGDGSFRWQNISVPAPASAQILVKVVATTQNPIDCIPCLHTRPGNILGSDFAGTVRIRADVPTDLRKLDERVTGIVHGG
ncbi:hypothetical protein B0H17DRAFT_833924, partial [Mycena rosella]